MLVVRSGWRRGAGCSIGSGCPFGRGRGGPASGPAVRPPVRRSETNACMDAFVSLARVPGETTACMHAFVSLEESGETLACMDAFVSLTDVLGETIACMHAFVSEGERRAWRQVPQRLPPRCDQGGRASGRAGCRPPSAKALPGRAGASVRAERTGVRRSRRDGAAGAPALTEGPASCGGAKTFSNWCFTAPRVFGILFPALKRAP